MAFLIYLQISCSWVKDSAAMPAWSFFKMSLLDFIFFVIKRQAATITSFFKARWNLGEGALVLAAIPCAIAFRYGAVLPQARRTKWQQRCFQHHRRSSKQFLWELHPPGAVNCAITGILLIKVFWCDFIGVTLLSVVWLVWESSVPLHLCRFHND